MRRAHLAVPAAVLTVALAPGAAGAALPDASSKKIVPGKSLGGVMLGATLEEARAAWGDGGRCTSSSCSYRADGDTRGAKGDAYFATAGDTIGLVRITAPGAVDGKPRFTGPLMKLKTSKKVGLGTKLKTLRKKYKKVRKAGVSGSWVLRSGNAETYFRVSGKSKRVEYILIQAAARAEG